MRALPDPPRDVQSAAVEDDVDRPRRGRPRDPTKDVAVLDAVVKLLAVEGVTGMSMDRVAATAGVSKVTVYTRWRSKSDLIGAALAHLQVDHVPEVTGDAVGDLTALLEAMRRQYEAVGGMTILGNCLVDEPASGELLQIIRESTLLPRRAHMAEVVRAGVASGQLRPDLDVEGAVSLLVGSLYADYLAGRPIGDDWAASVVRRAMRGLAV